MEKYFRLKAQNEPSLLPNRPQLLPFCYSYSPYLLIITIVGVSFGSGIIQVVLLYRERLDRSTTSQKGKKRIFLYKDGIDALFNQITASGR